MDQRGSEQKTHNERGMIEMGWEAQVERWVRQSYQQEL